MMLAFSIRILLQLLIAQALFVALLRHILCTYSRIRRKTDAKHAPNV